MLPLFIRETMKRLVSIIISTYADKVGLSCHFAQSLTSPFPNIRML